MTYEEAKRLADRIDRTYPDYVATARLYVHPVGQSRVVDVKHLGTGRTFSVRSWHEWQSELEQDTQQLTVREAIA